MKRVTGIGGIFFKAKDAPALQAWYKRHLGIDVQEWGGTAFTWTDGDGKPVAGTTVWRLASPLENADREMRRVLRIVDPHGRDRNARRHLHRREQRIEAV